MNEILFQSFGFVYINVLLPRKRRQIEMNDGHYYDYNDGDRSRNLIESGDIFKSK